jgi:hypothetical protein
LKNSIFTNKMQLKLAKMNLNLYKQIIAII